MSVASRVEEQEVCHNGGGNVLGKTTCHVIEERIGGAVSGSTSMESFVLSSTGTELGETFSHLTLCSHESCLSVKVSDKGLISTRSDTLNGSNNLQLAGTLVDGKDTSITIEAFARIFLHEAGTTMNLDTIVSALISELRSGHLHQRSEDVGGASSLLAGASEVDPTSSLIHEGTSTFKASSHASDEILNGYEVADCMSELFAGSCINLSFAESSFAKTDGLSTHTKASTIHQRHYIFDKT